ncbi:MAG: Rid family detoxifying hydrolase [Halobacteriales archaeon]|nr:Rid family detoxifying hydrolase [Halobacteriales archaeon]
MKNVIETDDAPEAVGAYSQGIATEDLVFTAGQVPLTPDGDMVEGGVAEQTERALKNVSAVLEAGSSSLEDAVKVTVFLNDIDDFGEMNSTYEEFFENEPPARSAVEVGEVPLGAAVEIEAVGAR